MAQETSAVTGGVAAEIGPLTRERRGFDRFFDQNEGLLVGAMSVLVFLLFWEWMGTSGNINPMFTSAPSRIANAFYRLAFVDKTLWKDMWVSGQEIFIGYTLSLIVGIPLGFALGWYKNLSYTLDPFISAFYATPRIALLPLFIIWFGIGINSKIAVIFSSGIFYLIINTWAGVRSIDNNYMKLAKSFSANDFQLLKTIALPACVPFVFTGMRLGLGRALVGMVVAELYAATAGVGYLITVAGATFQTDKVFVGVLIIATFGVLLTGVISRVEDRYSTWRPQVT